jgi:hypothetical protein
LDPDPYPDPYWSPASTSGSGSVKNEYGSETLVKKAPDPGSGSATMFATVLLRYCMNTTVLVQKCFGSGCDRL